MNKDFTPYNRVVLLKEPTKFGYIVDILDSTTVEVMFPTEETIEDILKSDLKVTAIINNHDTIDSIILKVDKVRTKQALEYAKAIQEKNSKESQLANDLKHYTNLLVDKVLEDEFEDFKRWFEMYFDCNKQADPLEPQDHPYLLASEIDRLSHGGSIELVNKSMTSGTDNTEVTCKSFEDIVRFYKEEFGV